MRVFLLTYSRHHTNLADKAEFFLPSACEKVRSLQKLFVVSGA